MPSDQAAATAQPLVGTPSKPAGRRAAPGSHAWLSNPHSAKALIAEPNAPLEIEPEPESLTKSGKPRKKRIDYKPDLAAEVCRRLSEGQTLSEIERDPEMPKAVTVLKWAATDEDFASMYDAAIAAQINIRAALMADEIIEIADDTGGDHIQTKWGPKVNHEAIKRSEVKINTRLKLLEKLKPGQWGAKQALELSGPGGKPLNAGSLTDVEVARRIAFALKLGGVALPAQQPEPIDVTPVSDDAPEAK